MKCMLCGNEDMQRTCQNVPYRSLPGTVLVDVEVWECAECGEYEVVIPAMNELERVLVRSVSEKPGRLTPPEIRFLRKSLGWSSADLARYFGVTPETVSRWENGRTMGAAAERLLRVCATRLDPIDDYEALEQLLNRQAEDPRTKRFLRLRCRGQHWEIAA